MDVALNTPEGTMAVITIGELALNSYDVVTVEVKNLLLLDCIGLMATTVLAFLLSAISNSLGTAAGLVLIAGYVLWKGGELFGERASYVVTVLLRNGTKVKLRRLTKAEALDARHQITKQMAR